MMSRLNQLNTRLALCSRYRGTPDTVGGVRISPMLACGPARFTCVAAAFRYRVPSSPMPWSALQQPDHCQPSALDDAVLGQCLNCVLATRRREPTRRQPQRRDRVAIQLMTKITARAADELADRFTVLLHSWP